MIDSTYGMSLIYSRNALIKWWEGVYWMWDEKSDGQFPLVCIWGCHGGEHPTDKVI